MVTTSTQPGSQAVTLWTMIFSEAFSLRMWTRNLWSKAGFEQLVDDRHDAGGLACAALSDDRDALQVFFQEAGYGRFNGGSLAFVEFHV